jgi:alpha-glucosidase (family GH31 glycosyl hydrolase)
MQGEGTSVGPYDPHIGKHTWLHNPERYARWLQAGVFQGIFRTHQSAPGDPTPWRYPNFEVLRAAMQVRGLSSPGLSSPGLSSPAGRRRPPQLRNALGPYIYTAAFEAHESGVLPCHPLYYSFPEEPEAYALSSLRGPSQPLQHSFGESFVVSPITQGTSVRSLISMRFWTELLRFLYVFVHCMFGSDFAVRR